MQGTAHQSGGIRTFGQIIAQPTIHKVGHALCRCGLPHVALLPAEPFYMFLKAHHAQGIIASFGKGLLTILRFHLHHHATVEPRAPNAFGDKRKAGAQIAQQRFADVLLVVW